MQPDGLCVSSVQQNDMKHEATCAKTSFRCSEESLMDDEINGIDVMDITEISLQQERRCIAKLERPL